MLDYTMHLSIQSTCYHYRFWFRFSLQNILRCHVFNGLIFHTSSSVLLDNNEPFPEKRGSSIIRIIRFHTSWWYQNTHNLCPKTDFGCQETQLILFLVPYILFRKKKMEDTIQRICEIRKGKQRTDDIRQTTNKQNITYNLKFMRQTCRMNWDDIKWQTIFQELEATVKYYLSYFCITTCSYLQ